jgi:hypothetical protein
MALLLRKSLILIKAESTYGSDISPAGTDAVLVRDLTITPLQSDTVSRDLVRPYLGASEQLLANTRVQCQFTVELAGSGTAGTAPRFGDALKACAMAETTTGAAVTGTATAGAANSITLAAGASSTDGTYVGQIITITSGTGSGHVGLITAYVGSTKVATVRAISTTFVPGASSGYSIGANVSYAPVSSSFSSVTIYYNVDGLLHKVTGARGTVVLNGEVGAIPTLQFTMTGIYNSPTDTAAPTATYTNQATPLIFKQGNTTAFQLYSYSGCLQSVSMDVGNNIVYRELIGCTKEVLITQRNVTGTVVIETPTIAAKDYFTAALADGTTGNFSFAHGTAAGNRVGLVLSTVDIGDLTYSGQDDIAMLNLPYTAIPSSPGNNEFILTFN